MSRVFTRQMGTRRLGASCIKLVYFVRKFQLRGLFSIPARQTTSEISRLFLLCYCECYCGIQWYWVILRIYLGWFCLLFWSTTFSGSRHFDKVKPDYFRHGMSTVNPHIESSNGSFQENCLNLIRFMSLEDVRDIVKH